MSKRPMSPPPGSPPKKDTSPKKFSPVSATKASRVKPPLECWATDVCHNYNELKQDKTALKNRKSCLMICVKWPMDVSFPENLEALVVGGRTAFRDCHFYMNTRQVRMVVFTNHGEHGSTNGLKYLNKAFGPLPQIDWMNDWKNWNNTRAPEIIVTINSPGCDFELSGDFVNEKTQSGCGPGDHFQNTDPEMGLGAVKIDQKTALCDCGTEEEMKKRLQTLRELCDAAGWTLKVQNLWRQRYAPQVTSKPRNHPKVTPSNMRNSALDMPNQHLQWSTLPPTLAESGGLPDEHIWDLWWWWWWHRYFYQFVQL